MSQFNVIKIVEVNIRTHIKYNLYGNEQKKETWILPIGMVMVTFSSVTGGHSVQGLDGALKFLYLEVSHVDTENGIILQ